MGKILQDIWIFTDCGISIYQRAFDPEKINEQRFAMFLSAVNSFAKKVYQEGITNFEVSDKKFSIIRKDDYLFIGNSDPKIKNKKVISELEEISKKFFDVYPKEVLDKWNGDLTIFANFENYIKDSIQKKKLNTFMSMI